MKYNLNVTLYSAFFLMFTTNVLALNNTENGTEDYSQLRTEVLSKKAADGDDRAKFQVANRALKGLGQPADPESAFVMFKALADKGTPEAQLNVGRMYALGKGTIQDLPAAKKYLEVPAKMGDSRAMFILANIEEQTVNSLAAAYSLYKMVANDNSVANAIRDAAQRKVSMLTAKLTSRERDAATFKTEQWLGIK